MKNKLNRIVATVGLSLLVLPISACGNQDLPTPKTAVEMPVLAVNPANLPKVLDSLNETILKADKDKNQKLLATRVDGAALNMREAQYRLAKKGKYAIPTFPVGSESTTISLSKQWPRVILNVTRADSKNEKYVEIITQDNPKVGFKLSQWMRLLPGRTFPATAVPGKGSVLVDQKDKNGLVESPQNIISKWPVAVAKPDSSEAKLFIENDFSKSLSKEPGQLKTAIKTSGGKLNAVLSVSQVDNNSISLALPDGSALTTATFEYKFKVSNIKKYKPLVFSGPLGSLLGNNGKVTSSASWTKTITVLFLVPKAKSKAKVQILAAENIITAPKK